MEATRIFQEYFSQKGLYENTLYDGVIPMLSALKQRGKQILLATSKPEEFALQILEHFGLMPYFDAVCGGSMDETSRIHKEDVIRYAMERGQVDPSRAVMIGDRRFDVEGGRACGMATLAVLYGYGTREELTRCAPDCLCQTVKECEEALLCWK